MRVAILSNNQLPSPTGFGTAIQLWSYMTTLIERGHEVHVCCYGAEIGKSQSPWHNGDYSREIRELCEKRVGVHFVERLTGKAKSAWSGRAGLVRKAVAPKLSD